MPNGNNGGKKVNNLMSEFRRLVKKYNLVCQISYCGASAEAFLDDDAGDVHILYCKYHAVLIGVTNLELPEVIHR